MAGRRPLSLMSVRGEAHPTELGATEDYMDSATAFRFICATYVKPGREKEFEDFVKDVVEPAARKAQPEMADKWTMLRPARYCLM